MDLSDPDLQLYARRFAEVSSAALKQRVEELGVAEPVQVATVIWRIKSDENIQNKIAHLVARGETPFINDYIGFRVTVSHVGKVPRALDAIRRWAIEFQLTEQDADDKYQHPGFAGYRAIHLHYLCADHSPWLLPKSATVEVQLTSWLQNFHAALSHRVAYKPVQAPSPETIRLLEGIGEKIVELDRLISMVDISAPDSQ